MQNAQKHFVKTIIKYYHGLGYDYLSSSVFTLEMPRFYEKRWDWTEDMAEKPHDQRTWLNENRGIIETREDFDEYP
jgi:hypothetical protein